MRRADVSGSEIADGRSPGREVPASPVSESRSEDRAKPERTTGLSKKQFQDANGVPKGARLLFAAAIAKQTLNRAQQIQESRLGL